MLFLSFIRGQMIVVRSEKTEVRGQRADNGRRKNQLYRKRRSDSRRQMTGFKK